jgi:hypothetical protein
MSNRKHNLDEVQEDDDGAVYVEPNIEHELSKDKRQACRDIILEIKNFGINQRQILFLIQLLSMELENGDAMRAINKAIGTVRKDIPAGNRLILPDNVK